ncbi:hypothetical protein PanWU01x14_209930 [Parasponia andersonii]|uniref:Uncharacterized protein n=1 Tax=Parasponia andersonii TaxID=3476 RepID=A0A2P5BU84_PARAD|nr:hypothetical protein PanWU01x14_209930 [Parasponia andersonii]
MSIPTYTMGLFKLLVTLYFDGVVVQMRKKDTLEKMVLKSKYFPYCSFLKAPLGSSPSYIKRSIVWGREVLNIGIRWRI